MSKINFANLKKTIYYLKRNGLRDTYLAALERLQRNYQDGYTYVEISKEEYVEQEKRSWEQNFKFSILVPTYQTNETYLREMIDSVLQQSYSNLELILADASKDSSVKDVVSTYQDERIVFVPLSENAGISQNTNAALEHATGDYIGLLDHDDVLTLDAIYEVALKIEEANARGNKLKLIYSDEDKCDETGKEYYEPHIKEEFNLDLILTNNYICHFTVMEAAFMKALRFRKEYDGAQDYDLVLRGIAKILAGDTNFQAVMQKEIAHVSKVLYHWRCHRGSTAANPQSKTYAYEAGKRAVESFVKTMGWQASVKSLKHLGFYQVDYQTDIFETRKDIGAVGGRLLDKRNRITGGIYLEDGTCPYQGIRDGYTGYMHKAVLQQDAYAVDIRSMDLREELWPAFEEIVGLSYKGFSENKMAAETNYIDLSLKLTKMIQVYGYNIVWMPATKTKKV